MSKPSEASAPVLIIGIGNELRGDDGAGAEACRELSRALPEANFETLIQRQLTPELADRIWNRVAVIVLDASIQTPPGRYRIRKAGRPRPWSAIGHHVVIEELAELSRICYSTCPRIWTVEFGAGRFDSQRIALEVRQAINRFVRRVSQRFGRPSHP